MSEFPPLSALDELIATVEAAEAHLEVLAATHLSYAAAARARRAAARRCAALLADVPVLPEPTQRLPPADDDTEEVLRHVEAEPSSPGLPPEEPSLDDLDEVGLVTFAEEDPAEITAEGDTVADGETDPDTETAISSPASGSEPGPDYSALVAFDDLTEDDEDDEDLLADIDLPGLTEPSGDSSLVQFEDDSLSEADDEAELEQASDTIPSQDQDDTQVAAEPTADPDPPEQEIDLLPELDDLSLAEEAGGDDLLLDLDSLASLHDELYEEEEEGDEDSLTPIQPRSSARPRPTPQVPLREELPETDIGPPALDDGDAVGLVQPLEPEESPAEDPESAATVALDPVELEDLALEAEEEPAGPLEADADEGAIALGEADPEESIELGAAEDEGGDDSFSLRVDEAYEYGEEPEPEPEPESEPEPEQPEEPTEAAVAALLDRAQQTLTTGDMHTAAELFSDVLDTDPDNLPAHLGRGRIYLDLGDFSRAMSDFTVAEELGPQSPEPQVAIGDMYFARKDYRKAIEYFNAALQMSPEHAMAHCRRGISHYYLKSYGDAVQDLNRAQRLDPTIPNIRTYVAMARKKSS